MLISYGDAVSSFPDPTTDLEGFVRALDAEAAKSKSTSPPVWDPIDNKVKNWIDSRKALRAYKSGGCSIS